MIVCHCHGVTDRKLRQLCREGLDTVEKVGRVCGAAQACGGCHRSVELVLLEERRAMERQSAAIVQIELTPAPAG